MAEPKLNPNTIPDAHAKEDKNTAGEDSGDQCEHIKEDQSSGPVAPTPGAGKARDEAGPRRPERDRL